MLRVRTALVGVFVLFLLPLALNSAFAQFNWSVETAVSEGYVGAQSSLVMDANGVPHVSHVRLYDQPALLYSKKVNGEWITEVVDTTVGLQSFRDTTIQLDAQGRPHISYYESYDSDLRYASRIDGVWVIEYVDSVGSVGLQADMVLDIFGNPHIAYVDLDEVDLRYATKLADEWTIEVVDSAGIVGTYPSIALDPVGRQHISYYDVSTLRLKYAQKKDNQWHTEQVTPGIDISGCTALAVDRRGRAKVAFRTYGDDRLVYGERNPNGLWTLELVDTGGDAIRDTQMVLGLDGVPHITFRSETTGGVKYVTQLHGMWYATDVNTPGQFAMGISVALDPGWRGNPRFTYLDVDNGDLDYAEAALAPADVEAQGVALSSNRIHAFPNPAAADRDIQVNISLDGRASGATQLRVVDVSGRLVRTLAEGVRSESQVIWDGRDDMGRPAAAGVYYLNLIDGSRPLASEPITLLR